MNNSQKLKLEQYIKILINWNEKFNLIGKSTINDIWNRHIIDSAQLIYFLKEEEIENCKCADFGTGAGFPGIVLSILGLKHVTLIEKSVLKCKFLKEAIKLSENKINIINRNIYDLDNLKFDIIFSRALSNLTDLIKMTKPFLKNNSKCIFLKGKKIYYEIEDAKKQFNFNYTLYDSKTSDEGKIIIITF